MPDQPIRHPLRTQHARQNHLHQRRLLRVS
ncbi:Uncharacterised protein [Vibrio cholerae]|nr:Uncharacterised protein [Vibrio cholerae]CSI79339.1 Uncharacterised protein [Vibrio cholerae]